MKTYEKQIEEIMHHFDWDSFIGLYRKYLGDDVYTRAYPRGVASAKSSAKEYLEEVVKLAPLGDSCVLTGSGCLTAYNWYGRLRLCGEFCEWDAGEV